MRRDRLLLPFSRRSYIGALCVLALFNFTFALERPTSSELQRYISEHRLQTLTARAFELGNHRVSRNLVESYKFKIQRLRDMREGRIPTESDSAFAPPPHGIMPLVGNVRVLALLIEFNDYRHIAADAPALIQQSLFGTGSTSLRSFYQRSSYGQLDIDGDVLGWYTTPYNRSQVQETQTGRESLVKEALNHYDQIGHNFAQYDNNGDGVLDYLLVFWAGPHGDWATFWWGYYTGFGDNNYTLDGLKFNGYSWQWESGSYPAGGFLPNVAIHETGHALGLPDLYDYTFGQETYNNNGVGGLDQMDANWGDHNCFSKFLLGWITPTQFDDGVHPMSLNSSSTSPDALVLWPYRSAGISTFDEYFMAQNRFRESNGNDVAYPTDGLLVWHIDATLDPTGTNFKFDNSSTEHKLVRLMEADGLEEIDQGRNANAGDFYVKGDEFSDNSDPNSHLYSGALTRMRVWDIGNSGPAMSLTVEYPRYIDLSKFRAMKYLCAIIGCDGPFRPWEKYINPSDKYAQAIKQGGARAEKLALIRQKALQLSTRMETAVNEKQIKLIEIKAEKLRGELNSIEGFKSKNP